MKVEKEEEEEENEEEDKEEEILSLLSIKSNLKIHARFFTKSLKFADQWSSMGTQQMVRIYIYIYIYIYGAHSII
jgi:hypothetical protein